nr:hypothetical protein [Tanacetum cinerariifolium]
QDAVCEHHEEHEIHDNVQLNHVVDSHVDYTSDSNMILYDQYVKDNAVPCVQINVSFVPNDAYMMIYNDMYEPHAQSVSKTSRNTVVDNSVTVELATYKEQVELYERRAGFKLTKREQKIDEQLRIVISDRNFKEETLKKELHSIKLQLASTINHNKSMVEEVKSLKKDFKQKENKYLEDFLDMKSLKEKVEDRLFKQDQSLQTVHMLCRPKPYYDELNKVAIGYKNLLCLTQVFYVATNPELNVARFTEMHVANTIVEARCLELKVELSNLHDKSYNDNHNELVNRFSNLQVTALTTKNVNLKAQILNKVNSINKDHVKPTVLAPGKYAIDVEPIPSSLRNNREAHLDYLRRLKESIETIREILQEAKVVRKKQVTFAEQCDMSNSNIRKHVAKLNTRKTNVPVPPSTGVNHFIDASESQPRSNTKKNRISPAKGVNKMQVEEHHRTNKGSLKAHEFCEKVHWDSYGDYVIGDSVISRINSGLVPNPVPAAPYVSPTDKDLEILFQPMFDEYLEPPHVERPVSPAPAV